MGKRTRSGSGNDRSENLLTQDNRDMLEFENASNQKATIKVVGVGGGGATPSTT